MTGSPIIYNSQRDNHDFDGHVLGNVQCFSTCAWMFMSYFTDEVDATDDDSLRDYVDDVESRVGSAGTAEDVINQNDNIKVLVRSGLNKYMSSHFWAVHKVAITSHLNDLGVNGSCVWQHRKVAKNSFEKLVSDEAPIILGTKKLGGLCGGHIILILAKHPEKDAYYVHDPFGDARKKYCKKDGANVLYESNRIFRRATVGGHIENCIFWNKNA